MAADGVSTRDKILVAAATMIGENPTTRLSVRAVAERAGVSVGSLRHFFPTQRALLDEVLTRMSGLDVPDDVMADTTLPARERLFVTLRRMLDQAGAGEAAREFWRATLHTYLDRAPAPSEVEHYLALDEAGRRRMERWLNALKEEGALVHGDIPGQARFLATVINGLAVERVLPMDAASVVAETTTLRLAVSAVVSS